MPDSIDATLSTADVLQPGPADLERWTWTKTARDILYSLWGRQLGRRVEMQVGDTRKRKWKTTDRSANLLKESSTELACLYDNEPLVLHDSETAKLTMDAILEDALVWPLMQTVERDARGLGNTLLRIDNSGGHIRYRIVHPDCVVAKADPNDPTVPLMIRWARQKHLDHHGWRWCWEEFDIRDPDMPVYRVVLAAPDPSAEVDVTEEVLGGNFSGERYPYTYENGTPLLPFVKYDARRSSQLWNWHDNIELVEGTLNNGVYWTFFGHNLRMASFRQRYGVNVTVPGANKSAEPTTDVTPDPANIVLFEVLDPDAGQPLLSEFDVPVDPDKFIGAVSNYERRVISKAAGIKPAAAVRTDGTPTSGYTFALSLEEKRAVQRRIRPMFAASDREMLRKTAAMHNRAMEAANMTEGEQGAPLPEDGWGIKYRGIPLSQAEQDALQRRILEKLERGLISPVDAHMALHEGMTRERAELELERIRQDRARFGFTGL